MEDILDKEAGKKLQLKGSKPQLKKSLGLMTVFLLIISSIIGSGVFKKIAPMSQELGSPTLVLACWGLAGLITLLGSLTTAEVAGLIADSGGQYVYFKKMYGKPFAFIYGWASFAVIQCATTASVAYVFAQSVNALIPIDVNLPPGLATLNVLGIFQPFDNFGVKLLTIALIVVLTAVNYRGVKYGGFVANIFASTVVISIFAIIILGLFFSHGSMTNLQQTIPSDSISHKGLFGAMFTGMLSAFWAYEGWNSVGFVGGEMKNPRRDLPLALIFGVLFVITTYLLINFTYLFVNPIGDIVHNYTTNPNSIAAINVMEKIMGPIGGMVVSVLIIVATFNCTNSQILTAPRIYFAMAKDGLFFSSAAKVHEEYKTPHIALVMSGVWASILVLSGSFDQLTDMLVFAAFIFYGAGAFGVFVLRRKMKDVHRPYKVIGYPVVPAIFILFCATLVIVSLIQQPREAGIGLSLILLGVPFYFYWKNKHGDVPEVEELEEVE